MTITVLAWETILASASAGSAVAVVGGAFALGLRHGIDWDHIAAITDITSTTTTVVDDEEARLVREPGIMLTDEDHHRLTTRSAVHGARAAALVGSGMARLVPAPAAQFLSDQRHPIWLGTLYALGHATVVTLLGVVALIASGFLPEWVDPIMGRIVGVTLLLLAGYLYYSIYRFFRGDGFRIRSRWMLLFAAVRNGYRWLQSRLHGHRHHEVAHVDRYGAGTAYGIGLIHGVGAETGTQVLVIATAVGASSTGAGLVALIAFVVGLVISNSVVTLATAAGFVSAGRRQWLYVAAGFLAATFSLVLGVLFVLSQDGRLPNLDPWVRWIGGPQ